MSNKNTSKNKSENNKTIIKKTEYTQDPLKASVRTIMQFVTSVYVVALLCVMPLYMENKYLNMGDAKYHFFLYGSIAMLGFLIVFGIQWLVISRDEILSDRDWLKKLSITEWCVLAFALVSVLSCIFAHYKRYAIWGYTGWNMGLISQLIFVLIFMFVSRWFKWNDKIMTGATVVGGVVFLIAVLQRFDLDILNLYYNIGADGEYHRLADMYVEKFVSTLGQTSWYSGYAVLIMPFGMHAFVSSKKKGARIWTALFILLGSASLCTVNNDSAYIATALTMLVFFCYSFSNIEYMARFFEILLIYIGTFRLIGVLQNLFPERMIRLISGEEKITKFITHSPIVVVLLVIILLIYLMIRANIVKAHKKKDTSSLDINKFAFLGEVAVWIAIVSVWLVVLLIIMATKKILPDFLSGLYNISFLDFNNDWGNYRGFNWRMAARAFQMAGIKDKLIGVGPDSFAWSMDTYCKAEVEEFWHGLQLACAHNEWFNMLITEGVLGVAAYLGIFVTSARRLALKAESNRLAIPCLAAIVAYMSYNFFCYQTCLCTPYIFMVMGISEGLLREEHINN